MTVLSIFAGALCGIVSGLGIGGGSLLILYLQNVAAFPQLESQFVNLLYFLPTSLSALVLHTKNKLVDFSVSLPAIFGGILSAILFSYLASLIDPSILKKIFGFLVILIGFRELRFCR